jgi:hypothetical protein
MTLPCLSATSKPRVRATKPGRLRESACSGCALEPEVLVKCCATCYPCIFICNSNAVTDDTWDLLIDGVLVGQHAAGMEYRATVVLPDLFTGKTINGFAGRGCNVFTWINTTALDTIKKRYILNMQLAVIQGYGNLGTVQILCARPEDDDTVTLLPTPGGSFTYSDPSPYVVGTKVRYPLRFKRE